MLEGIYFLYLFTYDFAINKDQSWFDLTSTSKNLGFTKISKNSGRFNFNNMGSAANTQSISLDEAYKILNLNPKKKYSKEEVMKSYKNIMKKIHPDVSPDLSRLAAIVNEAKEIVLKDVS